MRAFLILIVVIALLVWGGLQVPRDRLEMRVLRNAMFIAAGIFGALLVSAMLQALFLSE